MRPLVIRVSVEGLLVGLGVVVGKTVGWILIVIFGLILIGEAIRWERERQKGSRPPRVPLEKWLQERIDSAGTIKRQRGVRGDAWFFGAMSDWDLETAQQMYEGEDPVAPELVDSYREDSKTGRPDGLHAPGDEDRYYDQRVAWLRDTLASLDPA